RLLPLDRHGHLRGLSPHGAPRLLQRAAGGGRAAGAQCAAAGKRSLRIWLRLWRTDSAAPGRRRRPARSRSACATTAPAAVGLDAARGPDAQQRGRRLDHHLLPPADQCRLLVDALLGKMAVFIAPQRRRPAMTQRYPDFIWHNGEVKDWRDATVHVMAHALHYGSSVFEGIRCYKTPQGPKIFRLTDHLKRLYASAKIYEMVIPYDLATLEKACRDVIAKNGFEAAYLRPVAYRGLGGFGLSADTPIDVAVATWEMGPYLGAGVLEAGIDACVSSWQRFAPNTIPAGAKAGGNYLSGTLIAREARRLG